MAWDGHAHSGLERGMQATVSPEGRGRAGWGAEGAQAWLQAGRGNWWARMVTSGV